MTEPTLRIDKWLWFARFFKSRTLATKACGGGRLRVNGELIGKAHQMVKAGDVLTFPQGHDIRVVRVLALGTHRGPAPEARALYDDLEPPVARPRAAENGALFAMREPGSGRPTKSERRATDRLKGEP
jgi:ribosome-associated heat shock protein Hsp15